MIRTGLAWSLLVAGAALGAGSPPVAHAQINRCIAPDGGTIYTDRKCSDLGAVERPARGAGDAGPAYRGGCARNLRSLIDEMTLAIDNQDVNRLAGLYHWPGMPHQTAYALMERLDSVARRPLLDITALRPAERVVALQQPGISATLVTHQIRAPTPRTPVALRVTQGSGEGGAGARTVFTLRRHLDCWWISF